MMHILAVDDEFFALAHLCDTIQAVLANAEVHSFQNAEEALQFAETTQCEIAFLDIFMPEIDGVLLAKRLKASNPKINIIFVTASEEHFTDALAMHASGYLLKPVSEKSIQQEIVHLRYLPEQGVAGIIVQTFGNFDVFINGITVKFSRSKAKEMLAYLVDQKGRTITRRELADVLFENQPYDRNIHNYLSQIIMGLKQDLHAVSADNILLCGWNAYAVIPDQFSCDLYQFENGSVIARDIFQGEYMSQYSWAEETLARLCNCAAEQIFFSS